VPGGERRCPWASTGQRPEWVPKTTFLSVQAAAVPERKIDGHLLIDGIKLVRQRATIHPSAAPLE
jgi:hypothetical protein